MKIRRKLVTVASTKTKEYPTSVRFIELKYLLHFVFDTIQVLVRLTSELKCYDTAIIKWIG